jgi:hypothetical protein
MLEISFLSIFTAATSFTTTAILIPSLLFKIFCRSVVFPEPKNPDNIVIGIGLGAAHAEQIGKHHSKTQATEALENIIDRDLSVL